VDTQGWQIETNRGAKCTHPWNSAPNICNFLFLLKIEFFSYNYGSRCARKPIKALKMRIIALFSKNTSTKEIARWVGAKGQVHLAKKAKTCLNCDVTHRKSQTQNEKHVWLI